MGVSHYKCKVNFIVNKRYHKRNLFKIKIHRRIIFRSDIYETLYKQKIKSFQNGW